METFFLGFILFIAVVVAMSIGFILKRKTISGSCGGISAMGMDKACDCDEPCDEKKARLAKADPEQLEADKARSKKEEDWQQNRIH